MNIRCPFCDKSCPPLHFNSHDGEITTRCCAVEPTNEDGTELSDDLRDQLFAEERQRVAEEIAEAPLAASGRPSGG
jgi:hypothetical protein